MNTTHNIQKHFTLHEVAMEALRGINRCQEKGDQWGVEFFSRIYANILKELTGEHVKKSLEQCLTDEQLDYILDDEADMQIDADGNLIFTPENE
jgi:hypothetical protein